MRILDKSIQRKYLSITVLLISCIVFFLTLVLAKLSADVLRSESQRQLSLVSKQSLEIASNFLELRKANLMNWANNPVALSLVENPQMSMVFSASLRDFLSEARKQERWIENILVLKNEEVIYEDKPVIGAWSEEAKSDFGKMLKLLPGNTFLLLKYPAQDNSESFLVLKSPIKKEGSEFLGEFVILMSPKSINSSLFANLRIGKYGFATLAIEDDSQKLQTPGLLIDSLEKNALVQNLFKMQGEAASGQSYSTENIEVEFHRINHSPFIWLGVMATRDIKEPILALIFQASLLGIAFGLIGIFAAFLFSRQLTRPISELDLKVKRLAAGDLSVQADIQSEDEIGNLARNFNSMARNLSRVMAEVDFLQRITHLLVPIKSMSDLEVLVERELRLFFHTQGIFVHLKNRDFVLDPPDSQSSRLWYNRLAEDQINYKRPLIRQSNGRCYGYLLVSVEVVNMSEIQGVLETVSQASEMAVESIMSFEESLRKAELDVEMKNAKVIQESLFTTKSPEVPGYEIGSFFTAASTIGGDWFRVYYDEKKHRLRIYIGDVTGHGMASALLTACAMGVVHTIEPDICASETEVDLRTILERLNHVVHDAGRGNLFMTFLICEIDVLAGKALVASAAHNHPILALPLGPLSQEAGQKSSVMTITMTGNPLGFTLAGTRFSSRAFDFPVGSVLVLYTDGLIESTNVENSEYELRRLKMFVQKNSHLTGPGLVSAIVDDFNNFRGSQSLDDDVSIVVIKHARSAEKQMVDENLKNQI